MAKKPAKKPAPAPAKKPAPKSATKKTPAKSAPTQAKKPVRKQEEEKPKAKKPAASAPVTKKPVVVEAPAQATKPKAKKKREATEEEVLDALKAVFPDDFGRKRTLKGIELTPKQITKFIKKAGGTYAKMSVDTKRVIGLNDDEVKKADADKAAADKAAKTRVSNEDAEKAAADRAQAFNDALAKSQNTAASAAVLKGANKIISQRLFGLAVGYKQLLNKVKNALPLALSGLAADVSKSDPYLSKDLKDAASSGSLQFPHESNNENDVGIPSGTRIGIDEESADFDEVKPYSEPKILAGLGGDEEATIESVVAPAASPEQQSQAVAGFARKLAGSARKHIAGIVTAAKNAEVDEEELDGYDDGDNGSSVDGDEDAAENADVQNPNSGKGKGKGKAGRPAKDTVKTLPEIRVTHADNAFLSSRYNFSRGFFNAGKKAAWLGMSYGLIDTVGTGENKSLNENGASVEYDNEIKGSVKTSISFYANTSLFTDLARKLAGELKMSVSNEMVPKHIMNAKLAGFLRSNGFDKYISIVRSNGDSTGAFGFMLFAGKGEYGSGTKLVMIPFGIVAASATEITTLCNGDFAGVTDDKLFLFIAKSVLSNGIATRGKVFGFSVRERSLLRPVRDPSTPEKNKIVKLPNGRIMYLPDVDRRNEIAYFRETMQLPETLDDVMVDDNNVTDMDKFRGGVVYVDHDNNVVFYYSTIGKLMTRIIKGAVALNDRDRANLMKPTPEQLGTTFDITNPEDRRTMSPYGASIDIPTAYFKYADLSALERLQLSDRDQHGFPGVSYVRNKATGKSFAVVRVLAEDLRKSFNGDTSYYNAVNEIADNMLKPGRKHNAGVLNDGGNAYALFDQNTGMDDIDNSSATHSAAGLLSYRDITAIHIALEIARKTKTDWPTADVLHERAEAARVRPPQPEDLEEVMGQFDGLKPRTEGGNDYYEFMPHQAYIERTFKHQRTAALDCDMGGGKTLMSSLDATRWIKTGVDGTPARPCILMPASLIHNYMKDVADNFFGKNLNFFVLSSATRRWSNMDQNKIREIGTRAPANTFYVCSYEFLGLDSYQIVTGKQQELREVKRRDENGKLHTVKDSRGNKKKTPVTIPIMDTVYPNAQLLLDLGINVIYLDESQKIKNKSSGAYNAVLALSSIPVKRIMTGTMVTRDVEDVFTQTSFIDGTMIGTRQRFQAKFCDPKKKTEIIRGLEKTVRRTLTESGVMQARRSMWMNLLPAKQEHFEFVDMSPEQGAVYGILMADVLKDNSKMLDFAQSYYGKMGKLGSDKLEKLKSYLLTLMTGSKTDDDDSEAAKIAQAMQQQAVGDNDEGEDGEGANLLDGTGRDKSGKAEKLIAEKKKSIATKAAMLQAFISAPQALKPAVFSEEAQKQLEGLNSEMPKTTSKDQRCYELIESHWKTLGGSYLKMSKQIEKYGQGSDRLRGKVIIFALNNAIVEHVYAYLKNTAFGKQTGIYIKTGEFAAKREENLDKFKNPEDESVSIIVAAETSVIYGQNMQAGDLMIKLTLPWTTGDYDQAVARIYRNGQKLPCEVVNISANGSFEVGKLAKFLIRENSNRKIISDYDNEHDLNAALGTLDDQAMLLYQTKDDIENLKYPVYDPDDVARGVEKPQKIGERTVNCIELHDDVYKSELKEAEKMANIFESAGYGSAGYASIPMASGNPVIEGESEAVKARDPETGEILEPGPFRFADQQFFNGENLQRAREAGNARGISAEIKKAREAELAERFGVSIWQTMNERQRIDALRDKVQQGLNAVVEANPDYREILRPADLGAGEANAKRVFVNNIVNALMDKTKPNIVVGDIQRTWLADSDEIDDDPFTAIAQATTLARLVYNIVLDEFTGTTHLSTAIGTKKDRRGNAIDITGVNETADVATTKKNVKIIASIMSGKAQITAPTPKTGTQQAMENEKIRNAEKKQAQEAVEDEDSEDEIVDDEDTESEDEDVDDEDAEEEETKPTRNSAKPIRHTTPVVKDNGAGSGADTGSAEGLVIGVAELVDVAEGEIRAGRNVPINDSIYVFANGTVNAPKWMKKLAQVKIGAGRSQAKFEKKPMWVYPVPATGLNNITALAKKIEGAGGFVEKVGTGSKQQYALVAEPSTEAFFRIKAPANFTKLEKDDMYGMRHHVAEAKTASRTKAVPEVELGILMFDRRVFIIALSVDTTLLQRVGFKKLELLRYDFENDTSIGKRLNLCFKRIHEAGIPVANADIVMKKLKILTKQNVTVYGPKPSASSAPATRSTGRGKFA